MPSLIKESFILCSFSLQLPFSYISLPFNSLLFLSLFVFCTVITTSLYFSPIAHFLCFTFFRFSPSPQSFRVLYCHHDIIIFLSKCRFSMRTLLAAHTNSLLCIHYLCSISSCLNLCHFFC